MLAIMDWFEADIVPNTLSVHSHTHTCIHADTSLSSSAASAAAPGGAAGGKAPPPGLVLVVDRNASAREVRCGYSCAAYAAAKNKMCDVMIPIALAVGGHRPGHGHRVHAE